MSVDIAPSYIHADPQFGEPYLIGVYYVIRCPGWPIAQAADMEDAQIAAELMERMTGRFPDGFPSVSARYVQEEAS